MAEGIFSCFILFFLILAFAPAMIAAYKKRRFTGWYVYSVFLFPVALAHSLMLKKPRRFIKIYKYDTITPSKRIKKIFAAAPEVPFRKKPSFRHLCEVFLSKLLFGILLALSLLALFRTFAPDTLFLRQSCMVFAFVFSVLFSLVELLCLSRLPLIADEITKRALEISLISVLCSLPLYLLKVFVLDKIIPAHANFSLFVCTIISFVAFIWILHSIQSKYYASFNRFFDYCTTSLLAYGVFAGSSLIFMSTTKSYALHYALIMPVQGFNLGYLSGLPVIDNLSRIYSAAFVHLFVLMILLISGLLCYKFKAGEIRARIEYRSSAFRMSQKRILRRHIPKVHK